MISAFDSCFYRNSKELYRIYPFPRSAGFPLLCAYEKYRRSSPSNPLPWRASSRAISCTVS